MDSLNQKMGNIVLAALQYAHTLRNGTPVVNIEFDTKKRLNALIFAFNRCGLSEAIVCKWIDRKTVALNIDKAEEIGYGGSGWLAEWRDAYDTITRNNFLRLDEIQSAVEHLRKLQYRNLKVALDCFYLE